MRPAPSDLVSAAFRNPDGIRHYAAEDWDRLIRQARRAGLLARLHGVLIAHDLADAIPAEVRWHFEAASTLADKQQIAVHWEIRQLRQALSAFDFPLILLKGAAYVAAGLPAASGRRFNDIDLLVPRARLDEVEAALMLAGWHAIGLSDYDQRYYRRWMHEIPPLHHVRRATVIDVHHAILPDTARYHPDTSKLVQQAVLLPDCPGVAVLAPADRILHAATHLFHDGELGHGLRDLSDLDLALRHAAQTPEFWPQLLARATELELDRSLFYALRYVRHFFATPIPDQVDAALKVSAPNAFLQAGMDGIFTRALSPDHPSCDDTFTPAARLAAYVRAHWLRMPAHLLIPHLFHKTFASPHTDAPTPKAA